jgi:hypothetical protein
MHKAVGLARIFHPRVDFRTGTTNWAIAGGRCGRLPNY